MPLLLAARVTDAGPVIRVPAQLLDRAGPSSGTKGGLRWHVNPTPTNPAAALRHRGARSVPRRPDTPPQTRPMVVARSGHSSPAPLRSPAEARTRAPGGKGCPATGSCLCWLPHRDGGSVPEHKTPCTQQGTVAGQHVPHGCPATHIPLRPHLPPAGGGSWRRETGGMVPHFPGRHHPIAPKRAGHAPVDLPDRPEDNDDHD